MPGLELHLNDWATGNRAADPPEAPLHGQFHATLEPSLGVFPFWEIGAYLQGAVRTDDGVADWAGVKAALEVRHAALVRSALAARR